MYALLLVALAAGESEAQSPASEGRLPSREEMLTLLLEHQYGHSPSVPTPVATETSRKDVFLEQARQWATCVEVSLAFDGITMRAGYWVPKTAANPLPAILALEPVWWPDPFIKKHIVDRVLARGYVFAGFWQDDLASFEDPDHCPAAKAHPDCDWGTAAIAAWGARTALTWLLTVEAVDADHVALWGHSRRGKACILAGALDTRFAAVIPHMSGMGGTASYRVRGKGAQELEQLLERYWLHPSIYAYIDREDELPFRQHWLHALVAPRPLLVHVGKDDAWGNPPGELAAWREGRKAYAALDAADRLGIYIGPYGHHDPNGPEGGDSWETALQFLDLQFFGKPATKVFRPAAEDD